MRALKERHPYIVADRKFTAGLITVAQAVGMMCADPEFTAECELQGHDKRERAEAIVRNLWTPRLLNNIKHERTAQHV